MQEAQKEGTFRMLKVFPKSDRYKRIKFKAGSYLYF